MSDKDDLIVAGVNQKDKGIWRDFYDRYYAALCSYVEKILFLTDAVEDLVQEVFISVCTLPVRGLINVLFPTPGS